MKNRAEEMFVEKEEGDNYTYKKNVRWDKIRGTFLKFARETDVIESNDETPDAGVTYTRWLKYMQQELGSDIILWVGDSVTADEIKEKMRSFFKSNDEFRRLVLEKWEYVPEEEKVGDEPPGEDDLPDESGAETVDDGGGSDASGGGGPTGITDYADEYGSDESESEPEKNGQQTLAAGTYDGDGTHEDTEKMGIDEMRNSIVLGNVYQVLDEIPSNSVDSVVTSPPYYNVRDYDGADGAVFGGEKGCNHRWLNQECKRCGAWRGQLGNEPEPEQFVDHLVGIFMKIKRVLKPTGNLWINIDDKYAQRSHDDRIGAKRKSMAMVPERLFMRLVSNGFLLRDKTLWVKQVVDEDNGVTGSANPHSGMDRFNHAWEPLWRFTLQEDYYFDLYPVMKQNRTKIPDGKEMPGEGFEFLGNLPDAWRMQTGRTEAGHFAVFSEFLPKRPIQTTVPRYCCDECGTPYARELVKENLKERDDSARGKHDEVRDEVSHEGWRRVVKDEGYQKQCNCDTDGTERGIVLEPFTGRGTTLKVASELNRDYVGVEISEEYLDIAHDFVPDTKQSGLQEW